MDGPPGPCSFFTIHRTPRRHSRLVSAWLEIRETFNEKRLTFFNYGIVFLPENAHAGFRKRGQNMSTPHHAHSGNRPAPPSLAARLRSLPLFADCSPSQAESLASHVEVVSYPRHQPIHPEGQPGPAIHVVWEGEVVLEKSRGPTEEPMRLSIVKKGECFGIGEFMLPATITTATALADCELLRISGENFRRYFLSVESIREQVMLDLSRIAKFLLFAVVAGTGTQMLAFYLRKQCLEQAVETDGKFHIQRKILQPEIASLLNMSREHVTRLFARLQEQGAVDFNRGYPIVDKRWLQSVVTDTDLADFIVYRDYPQ